MESYRRKKRGRDEDSSPGASSTPVTAHSVPAELARGTPLLLDLPTDLHVAILVGVERSAREVCTAFRDSHDAGTVALRLSWQAVTSDKVQRRAAAHLARRPQLLHLDARRFPDRPAHCLGVVALPHIRSLDLQDSFFLTDLSALTACVLLQSLDLRHCRDLVDISPLSACTSLRSVVLDGCYELASIAPLASCCALECLGILNCREVEDLTPLAASSASLQLLNLHGCSGITALDALAACTALVCLDLGGVSEAVDLSPLASLALLAGLGLSHRDVADIGPVSACTGLRQLNLSECWELADVVPLSACRALRWLDLSHCHSLRDVSPLAACTALCRLDMGLCHAALDDLGPLAPCTALEWLGLHGAPGALDGQSLMSRKGLQIDRSSASVGKGIAWSVDTPSFGAASVRVGGERPCTHQAVCDGVLC